MKSIIFALFVVFLLTGCATSKMSPYKSEITGDTAFDCSDLYPSNPFDETGSAGHYAGFAWAENKEPSVCGGNSQSFIEGCEEWQMQEEDYETCLNK